MTIHSQPPPNSLNESITITFDFINQEVKLKKKSIQENKIRPQRPISELVLNT
jgi:hypothetical protein